MHFTLSSKRLGPEAWLHSKSHLQNAFIIIIIIITTTFSRVQTGTGTFSRCLPSSAFHLPWLRSLEWHEVLLVGFVSLLLFRPTGKLIALLICGRCHPFSTISPYPNNTCSLNIIKLDTVRI